MDRIIEQLPRFFSQDNMILLVEAAGLTIAMTAVGCLIGFALAFGLVYLRQTPGTWATAPSACSQSPSCSAPSSPPR